VFGAWQTVRKRHRRFSLDGTYDRLLTELQVQADAVGELDWQVSVDSTIARVHQDGATAREVSVEAHLAHGGRRRMTRTARCGRTNRTITASGGPAAA
jgi:transposase